MLTEEDLNWLNQYVYNVDHEKLERTDLKRPRKDEILKMQNGTEVFVVDLEDNNSTGYQGLAVAPMIGGKPDYSQIAVVSAGTDPSQITTDVWSALFNGNAPFQGDGQIGSADEFVNRINSHNDWNVTQLSGYSQSAYMLKIGAKYKIPTTVYNGWFLYANLSDEEKEFMKNNPDLFLNYRHTKDLTTALNDANWSWWAGEDYGTIIWIDGSSHKIYDWKFDKEGKLIVDGDLKEQTEVSMSQIENNAAILLWNLSDLAKKLKKSGGGLSDNEAIFIDSSQALIIVESVSRLMKIGLASVIKVYQEAIEEAEELWNDALQLAQNIASDLSDTEVMESLELGGVTEEKIVNEPTTYYEEKIENAKKIGEGYDRLIVEIKESITLLITKDEELASQL